MIALEFLAWLTRWLEFAGVLALAGNAIFRIAVHEGRLPNDAANRLDLFLYGSALLLLTLVTPLDILLRAAQLAEKPIGEIFTLLPSIILETHAGRIWLIKIGALVLGWVCLITSRRIARWGMPASALLWMVAVSLSGHAADEGIASWEMLADIVHVTAAGAWIGGLVPLVLNLRRATHQLSLEAAGIAFVRILKRFSTVATVSVGGILLSGVYVAWHRLPHPPSLPGNAYGHILVLKLGLVAVILGLGGLNKWYLLPRLESHTFQEEQPEETVERHLKQQVMSFLALEAALAAAVLGCAALLAQSSADM